MNSFMPTNFKYIWIEESVKFLTQE